MASVKLSDLILDYNVYPRNDISSVHVTSLCDALEIGDPVPPITVCGKTKRISDGFHRFKAHERLGREMIEVVWRDYKNDAELFKDAVRMNVSHGRAFDPYDRKRAVLRLKDFGLTPRDISDVVRLPMHRVEIVIGGFGKGFRSQSIVLKSGLASTLKQQHTLTQKQEKTNERWSGSQPAFHVNQLVLLLEAEIVPKTSAFVAGMDRLCELWLAITKKNKAS